jgi:hypothetical protein
MKRLYFIVRFLLLLLVGMLLGSMVSSVTYAQTTTAQTATAQTSTDQTDAEKIIPSVPVVLDGVQYSPAEFARLSDQPRDFVVDQKAEAAGVILAFSTTSALQTYMESQGTLPNAADWQRFLQGQPGFPAATPAPQDVQPASACDCIKSRFYQDIYYESARLTLCVGGGYSQLRAWDNQISSVVADGRWTALFSLPDYGGSRLWIRGALDVRTLVPYGWNDIASSLAVYS